MKILTFSILFISFCVFTEALLSFDIIRKINRVNKSLKKHIYEKENRKGNHIMKNQGIISFKFIHRNSFK
jgi:hypothetical protein